MSIKYPVEGMTANRLYQINQEGKAGFFPIGVHNFWHGGVNLTLGDDDLSIRAVAKGKIIAYRFTQGYCDLSETYPDGEEDKKYYEKDYSHNFVLIKHNHEPENSPPLEYYSLYMHLAPFNIYDEKYDKNKVSIFKRWKCFINTQKDGNGGNLRDRAGNKIGVIPQGAVVTQTTDPNSSEGYINNTEALNYIYVTSAFGDGYISEQVCLESISAGRYRCKVNGGACDVAKKGLNVYESPSFASAVVAVLPKDTEFYFEEPYRYISKNGQIGSGMAKIKTSLNESSIGYIQVNSTHIRKGEKVIDPVLSDSAQICQVDVHAGEILGWPGSDGVADNHSFHFEIFTKNEALFGSDGFWNIADDQGKPDSVYKILKDTPLSRMRPNQPISGKTIAKNTILELMDGVNSYGAFPKANARKVKIVPSESKEGWFLHSELAWQGNVKKYYYTSGDVIEWMWLTNPTTSAALTAATRDEFVGLGKTFADDYLEFRYLERGEVDGTNIRKVSFTTPNPNQSFQGWVKDESNLVGGIYTENGTRKKRYYAAEELTELYTKNPEFAEFAPSGISTTRDVYVNKKDCPIARDLNEDTWIGFPKAFLESGEIFFDKDEFDEIDQWLWLKEDHGSLQTVNPFAWDEFFEKCLETDVALGEDGFCDAGRIYELVDANYSGEFEASEYRSVVANDSFKQQLRQILVEHPSEWFLPSEGAMNDKWGTRLQAPPFDATRSQVSEIQEAWIRHSRRPPRFGFNFTPEKYTAFKEVVTKTCFLHQIDGFTENEKLWYFHPIAFVQHLKRLFPDLDILMSSFRLSAKEIALARKLIKELPESERKSYYIELQKKVHYKNQRNNNQATGVSDRMCNLTSLAMALEYLGVENPSPEMQFEDYLENKRATDYSSDHRIFSSSWNKLAADFEVEMKTIGLNTSDRDVLTNNLKPELESGNGVIISAFSRRSGKGHIVRLQEVVTNGLIVDDPFGKINDFAERENPDGGSGYTGTANTKDSESGLGEDNLWTWANIADTVIKYSCSFSEK